MEPRPRSITIIGWFFVIFGSILLIIGLLPPHPPAELKNHWYVHLSHILQIIGGVFLLRGKNWARLLLVAWMAFHLIISVLHSWSMLASHVAIFSVILFFLFQPAASRYFRADNTR